MRDKARDNKAKKQGFNGTGGHFKSGFGLVCRGEEEEEDLRNIQTDQPLYLKMTADVNNNKKRDGNVNV